MINVNGICKKYKKKVVLEGINFILLENQVLGLVGPNGAGKSTLMRIVSGINSPTAGKITKDSDISISAVFDSNGLYPQLTAMENLIFFYRLNKNIPADETATIYNVLQKMQLYTYKDVKVRLYSKGMARKLAIARALISSPNVLILDEPFDGLDAESHAYVMHFFSEWIKGEKRAIILSSHNMSDIENICTEVIILKQGKAIFQSSLETLRMHECQKVKIRFAEIYPIEEIKKILFCHQIYEFTFNKNFLLMNTTLAEVNELLYDLITAKYIIVDIVHEQQTLEELYINTIGGKVEG